MDYLYAVSIESANNARITRPKITRTGLLIAQCYNANEIIEFAQLVVSLVQVHRLAAIAEKCGNQFPTIVQEHLSVLYVHVDG